MSLFKLGKSPKPKGFNFIPRHYDPVKEEISKRTKKYDQDLNKTEVAKSRISQGLRAQSRFNQKAVNTPNSGIVNKRLLYIIVILFFLAYMILSSDSFLRILQSLSSK